MGYVRLTKKNEKQKIINTKILERNLKSKFFFFRFKLFV